MRLLLDQNLPRPLMKHLIHHRADHAHTLAWGALPNGELVAAADAAGYDVLLTADQSLSYQQNLADRRIGLVVISTNPWPEIRAALPQIVEAIDLAQPGAYLSVPVPQLPRKTRRPPELSQQ